MTDTLCVLIFPLGISSGRGQHIEFLGVRWDQSYRKTLETTELEERISALEAAK